jgi:hypothetical protein
MPRVKQRVIFGQKVKALPKAKGSLQNIAKSKVITKIQEDLTQQGRQQTQAARDQRSKQKQNDFIHIANLRKARTVKRLQHFQGQTVPFSSPNINPFKVITPYLPIEVPTFKPAITPKKTEWRTTAAGKIAEIRQQVQAGQKQFRQALDAAMIEKDLNRAKTRAALQARSQRTAQQQLTKTKRQANISTARILKGMRNKTGSVVSSNVAAVDYNELTSKLYVAFLNGSEYEYDLSGVSDGVKYAIKIYTGQASCTTKGVSQYNGRRWWVGKNPSVGAAVWKYLRRAAIPYRKVSGHQFQYQQVGWP